MCILSYRSAIVSIMKKESKYTELNSHNIFKTKRKHEKGTVEQ